MKATVCVRPRVELARVRLKVKGQREEWYIPLNIIHIFF